MDLKIKKIEIVKNVKKGEKVPLSSFRLFVQNINNDGSVPFRTMIAHGAARSSRWELALLPLV